jgi:hypothetical protein
MSPKIGRPIVEEPKDARFSIRLDANTEKQLDDYCKKHNKTKGEVIRYSLILFLAKDIEQTKYKDEEERLKKLRKRAKKVGYGIRKGKFRRSWDAVHWHVEDDIGYMMFSYDTNQLVLGFDSNTQYNMTLDEVEENIVSCEYNQTKHIEESED